MDAALGLEKPQVASCSVTHLPLCMCASGLPGDLLCSGEVGNGGGWQGKVSSPLLQCGPGQPNSPTHSEESTAVWPERRLKCWQRVLGAPAGPGSQSLDCWIFQGGLGHRAPLGKYQPMWRRYHRSSLFLDSVFASLSTH